MQIVPRIGPLLPQILLLLLKVVLDGRARDNSLVRGRLKRFRVRFPAQDGLQFNFRPICIEKCFQAGVN
jgi:hypothetical protein